MLLGLANVVFGVLSLATDLVRLSGGTARLLLALGLGTAVVGVFVWRGSRGALLGALVAFGLLLLLESVRPGEDPLGRVVVLAVVVAALAFAWLKGRGNLGGRL